MKHTDRPLTKEEHLLFAEQLYILRDALMNVALRHKKGHPAAKQAVRTERALNHLRCVMDDYYCAQFPDDPRPADPGFMDSPYYSAKICERVERSQ